MTPDQHVPLISGAARMIQWPTQRVATPRVEANLNKVGPSSD